MREWLIEARKKNNLSQQKVAEAIHITQGAYSQYEHGICTPKPDKAKAIGALLGFPWFKFYE